jgi:hypothetical protein
MHTLLYDGRNHPPVYVPRPLSASNALSLQQAKHYAGSLSRCDLLGLAGAHYVLNTQCTAARNEIQIKWRNSLKLPLKDNNGGFVEELSEI